jgi:Family of unknown function (DUF6477)
MPDTFTALETIRRPRLLMQAARFGMAAYRRNRDLRRLLGAEFLAEQAIARLISEEEKIEETRIAGLANYSPARHVELLSALIAEAYRLPRNVI